MLLLIYIPIVASIVWACMRVHNRKNIREAILVASIGAIVVFNGIVRHFVLAGYNPANALIFVQQAASSMIIPCSYMYFARQVGRPLINGTSTLLLYLIAFLAFPNFVIVYNDTQTIENVGYLSLVVVGKDTNVYSIADLIIVLQSVITIIRLIPLYRKVKKYGLSLSNDVKGFMVWWFVATIFVVFASYNSEKGDYNATIDVICKVGFMLIVTRAFYKIGKGFDLRPICGDEHVELNEFVSQSHELALRILSIIKDNIQSCNADSIISELGTNRTYFYKIVKAEYGYTFSELVNRQRVKAAKEMLLETDYCLNVIADKCGFSSASYMIKIFKNIEGVTPKEWRDSKIVN